MDEGAVEAHAADARMREEEGGVVSSWKTGL